MVDANELIGQKEIAELLGTDKAHVWNWTRSPTTGFPEPDVAHLAGRPLWVKQRVLDWYDNWSQTDKRHMTALRKQQEEGVNDQG